MKTVSALLQTFALAALFTAHVAASEDFRMPGVRRALETIARTSASAVDQFRPAVQSDVAWQDH